MHHSTDVRTPNAKGSTVPKPLPAAIDACRPRRRTALHRASRRLPHLIIVGCCALTVAGLSGCVVTGNSASVGDLANTSVQDALSDAANQLSDAAQDVTDALSGAQSDIADALSGAQSDIADALDGMAGSLADAGSSISDLANLPQALHSMLSDDALASKDETVEVVDLNSNATIASYGGDNGLLDTMNDLTYTTWKLVPSHPDEGTAQYLLRFTQNETQKAGQDQESVQRVELGTFTLYENSNVIQVNVTAVNGLAASFELPDSDMAKLRDLIP